MRSCRLSQCCETLAEERGAGNPCESAPNTPFGCRCGAHCLTRNVTGELPPMIGIAPPNRLGGADGGNDQHGRAARGFVGGGGALPVGRTGGEGARPRRAVPDDRLASQTCRS